MFDIEKRLEKLEKSNRRMKSIAIVATLACVGFMTIAATPRGDGHFNNLIAEGYATILGDFNLGGSASLSQNVSIAGNANITGDIWHSGDAILQGYTSVHGPFRSFGEAIFEGPSVKMYTDAEMWYDTDFYGSAYFHGPAEFLSSVNIQGQNVVSRMDGLQDQLDILSQTIDSLTKQLNECCGAVATCPSDLNDDENVGVDDLLTLIADWGDCS